MFPTYPTFGGSQGASSVPNYIGSGYPNFVGCGKPIYGGQGIPTQPHP
jgi:hypothetical protein